MSLDFTNVFSLEGKTALVVGVGGLGEPIAEALLQNGANLVLAGRKLTQSLCAWPKMLAAACGLAG